MDKAETEELNGILCVDKPQDFTSFDVIAKLRGILHMRRLGHAGTLDPMATGVLVVLAGRATRACDILPIQDKKYRVGFQLGMVSDTQDIWGDVTKQDGPQVAREQLEKAVEAFTGDIQQIPPMYSAVQVNGRRLYDLARQGVEVDRQPRPVTIYSAGLTRFDEAGQSGEMEVSCSKGTYIRTLCHDIGEALGCGGIMTSLRRTYASGFEESSCFTLDQLQVLSQAGRLEEAFHPVGEAFATLPPCRLDSRDAVLFCNGAKLPLKRLDCPGDKGDLQVLAPDGTFLGIGTVDNALNLLRVKKLFALR